MIRHRDAQCLLLILSLFLPAVALATNGDTLLGVGPSSRAMAGVGVAVPRDAISAIFANPAVMCDASYCDGSQTIISATVFDPTVRTRISAGNNTSSAKSDTNPTLIPAIGITTPITPRVRFGFGAYGISGMGVDYRHAGIDLDGNAANGFEGDIYTKLQVMKLAPGIAMSLSPNVSVGAALHVVYGTLDLGQGDADGYTVGGQMGIIARRGPVTAGIKYSLPERITYDRVYDLDGNGAADSLALESPQSLAGGIAFSRGHLLLEADVKWHDWSGASGYRDFGWKDQWVYAVGLEYHDWHSLTFRAGYNYGKSPVRPRNGFDPGGKTEIQGTSVFNSQLEYLRIVGFPAIAEHHFTGGIAWRLSDRFQAHAGFTYSPKQEIEERSALNTMTLSSEMSQQSYELGLTWSFF
jgi:long-chain fatty acid transport protein